MFKIKYPKYSGIWLVFIVLAGIISGCSARTTQETISVSPPVETVKVKTNNGNGIVILIMRKVTDPLSIEDTERIKAELSNEIDSGIATTPIATATSNLPDGEKFIAFGYAIYKDGKPSTFWGPLKNNSEDFQSINWLYKQAEDWFVQTLADTNNN